MARYRRWLLCGALLVLGAACGDDSDASGSAADPSTPDGVADVEPESNNVAAPETGSADGGGSAIITTGGSTVLFSMNDVTFSPFEGVEDTTFETCDSSFFGAAFRVIGYPVDESGELIFGDDGRPAGALVLMLPVDAEGEEVAGPAEFELVYSPLELDVKIPTDVPSAEAAAGVTSSWSFDGNRVSGTAVLANVLSEPTVVEFDVTCG